MTADPLTPAEAVAIAAVLEAHPTREKHWLRWVKKLRAIANESSETIVIERQRTDSTSNPDGFDVPLTIPSSSESD